MRKTCEVKGQDHEVIVQSYYFQPVPRLPPQRQGIAVL